MLWIFLSVLAAFIFAIAHITNKHVISDELRDPILATTISGIVFFLIFSPIAFDSTRIAIPLNGIILAILAGVFYNIGIFFYYQALQKEEVSRVIPILSMSPLFVVIGGAIFLNEQFSTEIYIGILTIIIGAFLISMRTIRLRAYHISAAFLLALGAAILGSTRNVIIKYLTFTEGIWPIIFWIGVGGLITSLIVIAIKRPHIQKTAKRGISHLVVIKLLLAGGTIFIITALSEGSASLVSVLAAGSQNFFTFFGATILSIFHPRIIHERISSGILLQKIIATTLIIGGIFLIF